MAIFMPAVELVLKHEGGLNSSSAKNDPGGLTNFGISLRFLKSLSADKLRAYGIYDQEVTEKTIIELTREQAIKIYEGEFWNFFRFGELEEQILANILFDCCINPNPNAAFKFLQRAIWTYTGYKFIKDDGIMGSITIKQANRWGALLVRPIMVERAAWYRENSKPEFIEGWLRRAYSEPVV